MNNMTYRQLLTALNKLSQSQLDCNVTVQSDMNEACFNGFFTICGEDDVLAENYPVIMFDFLEPLTYDEFDKYLDSIEQDGGFKEVA